MSNGLLVRAARAEDIEFVKTANLALAQESEAKHLDPATVHEGVRCLGWAPA